MIAAVLFLLDTIIGLAGAGACVSALFVIVGFVAPTRPTRQQASERLRWYRERLQQGRRLYEDAAEDQHLARLLHTRNLRGSWRERVFLSASVTLPGQAGAFACTVLDISDTGARLSFGHVVSLPGEIELEIKQRGRRVRAQVVWSHDHTCGIRFIAELTVSQSHQPTRLTPAHHAA
jgi:hypothetical protein